MAWYNWSQTANSNATADPTQNWSEGMAPSAINDSARALMAASAKYRDDIAGAIVTAGTSTAYTVTSFSVFDTLAHLNGQMIAFTPHATNGATVTLNVDSLGAKPLRTSPNTELLAGVLIQGTPYVVVYNNADGAFYLRGFFGQPLAIPLGAMLDFTGTTAPNSNYVLPFGQAISRTTYATYFAMVSTTFGAGDGSTTFNIPDLRGRVLAGKDDMGGSAANRLTSAGSGVSGTTLGATGGAETYTQIRSDLPNVAPTFTGSSSSVSGSTASSVVSGSGLIGGVAGSSGSANAILSASIGSASVSGSTTAAGTVQSLNGNVAQTAMKTVPPVLVANKILRII